MDDKRRSLAIEEEFGVSYQPGYVSRLLRHTYGMSYTIPRPETPARPDNAEEILAERLEDALGEIDADCTKEAVDPGETMLGFFDESWPMPTDNKHRLWGFGTPLLVKNMPNVKTTAVGFYAVNGTSVLRSLESLEQEQIGEMSEAIRKQNPRGRILLVLDNFSSHICAYTREKAAELDIVLVFLPVASSHLQPIEPVWGKLKHDLSPASTESADHFRALVEETFLDLTQRLSFAADWLDQFLDVNWLR